MSTRYRTIISQFSPFALICILLLFVFSFLYKSDSSFNQDLGMHLKLGEIIWSTHSFPKINLFSYTNTQFPFINHHWLFEVLAYLGGSIIGLENLIVIKIILLLFIAFTVLLLAKKTNSVLFFSFSFLFLHLLRERTDLRPELLSFLFTSITLCLLELYEKRQSKLLFLLPIISLFWVNSHIYFPVGIFLQIIFIADVLVKKYISKKHDPINTHRLKTLLTVFILSILASLLNPNFIKGAIYPFTVFGNYGVTITENQTIFTLQRIHFVNPDFLFFYVAAIAVFGSIYASFWRTKFSFKNIVLSLLGLGFAIQSIRGFPYLVIISLPYVLLNFNYKTTTIWIKVTNFVIFILLMGESWMYLNGSYYNLTYQQYSPKIKLIADEKPAVDFLLNHTLPQPVFNNFDTGSYFLYRSYPRYKVFIDERPEAYPASFFTDVYLPMQEDYKKFEDEQKLYNFRTILFAITDQNPRAINFLNHLLKDRQWQTVFLDQSMIILVQSNTAHSLHLPKIAVEKLRVEDFHYTNVIAYNNLSAFFANIQQLKEAELFDRKALMISPDNPAANKNMVYIMYLKNQRDYRMASYLAKTSNWVFW